MGKNNKKEQPTSVHASISKRGGVPLILVGP